MNPPLLANIKYILHLSSFNKGGQLVAATHSHKISFPRNNFIHLVPLYSKNTYWPYIFNDFLCADRGANEIHMERKQHTRRLRKDDIKKKSKSFRGTL